MAWAIASNKTSNPHSHALRWRLLLSYLTVMMAILAASTVAVYQFTRRSLYEQLDQRLSILAQAASHSLLTIKAQYAKEPQIDPARNAACSPIERRLDRDQDLDIPWQQLREYHQGVEWFDGQRRLVGNAGTLLHGLPPSPGYQTLQQGKIRAVTLAVYGKGDRQSRLEGYIRTSEETQEVEAVLSKLRWGLGVGGAIVLGVTGLGGIWLTRQSVKPIEQSFQQLKQFTADAAHELRSPLAAIKTSVQVMQYYPERIHPQDMKKLLAIAATTNHTIRLVEDLLLLSRIDVAAITQKREWVCLSLDKMIEDVLVLLQPQAQEKGITLQVNLLTGVMVNGDALQLTRLFRNLLENALQYTPAGGKVTLAMKLRDRFAIVSVDDTGIGIAPADLKFVFDRFWRADKARSRREGGMGMGLAIAQSIAQHHRGEIVVSSQLGVGSCFQVRLPLA
ncbi:sensor histidine kinase [Microseira wollei]|uniref:histidine kinase n=1 Tax=Microseira wollei NIES-4236 TaxID=2530354 RepID=A0AAV3XEM6_9CYAN|nr:HAMP domain-containing sensor histidine kinase [Microseira wollei]GET41018.1 histidine kinase [Microseira wollei NIES-4236]